jgi:hypothetical protein
VLISKLCPEMGKAATVHCGASSELPRLDGRVARPHTILFLSGDQLAILDFDAAHVIWQLQTIFLFGEFFL